MLAQTSRFGNFVFLIMLKFKRLLALHLRKIKMCNEKRDFNDTVPRLATRK